MGRSQDLPNIKGERGNNVALFLDHRHALGKPRTGSTTAFPQESLPNTFCRVWRYLHVRVHLEMVGHGFRL